MSDITQKHRHKWELSSYGAGQLTYSCACKATKTRTPTNEELVRYEYLGDLLMKDLHGVYHEYKKAAATTADDDLESLAETLSAKYPGMVDNVGVDDTHFTSSCIIVIHHGTGDNYMGASCIMISQCSGQEPAEWFVYPGHAFHLADIMDKVAGNPRRKVVEPDQTTRDSWVRSYHTRYKKKPCSLDAFDWARAKRKKWYQGKDIP